MVVTLLWSWRYILIKHIKSVINNNKYVSNLQSIIEKCSFNLFIFYYIYILNIYMYNRLWFDFLYNIDRIYIYLVNTGWVYSHICCYNPTLKSYFWKTIFPIWIDCKCWWVVESPQHGRYSSNMFNNTL